jgi:hypothetical protein
MNSRPTASSVSLFARAGWILAAVSLLALGALWAIDRARPREVPGWTSDAFVALHAAPGAPQEWRERWVVAYHPGCPHCRACLASLAAARDRSGAAVCVTALLVDSSAPPADSVLRALPADETWWDERRRWRDRWGQRVYGVIFCFDPGGRLLRELAPVPAVEAAARRLSEFRLDAPLD